MPTSTGRKARNRSLVVLILGAVLALIGAVLAVGRFEALGRTDARHVSLSPASLLKADGIERLVLPSPNGSTTLSGR